MRYAVANSILQGDILFLRKSLNVNVGIARPSQDVSNATLYKHHTNLVQVQSKLMLHMGKSSKCDRDRVSDFSCEGQFLGFTALDGYKLKYLRLSTPDRDYVIKIPKEQRLELYRSLRPGDRIQCAGEQKSNAIAGEGKLKAYTISKITEQSPKQSEIIHLHGNVRDINGDRTSHKQHTKSGIKPLVNVLVCQKSDCAKRGSGQICSALMNALEQQDLADYVKVKGTGCMKHCKSGPHVVVMPDKSRFSHVKVGQVQEIVAEISNQISEQTMPKAG